MRELIDITVEDSISERWLSVGWDGLTQAEQEFLALDWVVGRISNSGIDAALSELVAEWPRAVDGLRRIGALKSSEALERGSDTLATMDEDQIRALEDDFMSHYEAEHAADSIVNYVAAHDAEFPGPRSLIEVWQSMQARGVPEKPRRLIEMERHAAADAALTERRCPACGQPVPKHKSKCRRCGRPYAAG